MILTATALASSILMVGEPINLGVGGGWARAFPAEQGWDFLWGAGGDFNLLPMTDALTVVDSGRRPLTGRTDLVDHAIVACPDGTFLHTASAQAAVPDDSAYAFRYDAAWNLTADGPIDLANASLKHNDMPLVCAGDGNDLVGFHPATAFRLAPDLTPTGPLPLPEAPRIMGNSFLRWEGATVLFGIEHEGPLLVNRYDDQLALIASTTLEPGPPGETIYWAQAALRVGTHVLVAFMSRDPALTWEADTGNVWLAVFDPDLALLESVQITNYPEGSAAMRPGLARKDDQLLVLFDKGIEPHVVSVTLDIDSLGVGEADTGGPTKDGCGCGTGFGGAAPGALVALAGILRRKVPYSQA